jgi:hypothetical protein
MSALCRLNGSRTNQGHSDRGVGVSVASTRLRCAAAGGFFNAEEAYGG